jgi:hypothetical protein
MENHFPIRVHRLDLLDLADIRRVNAALGWLGLDSPADARAELEAISSAQQSHPLVLETHWRICAHEENWRDGLAVAERELATIPGEASGWLHRAYALRRIDGGGLAQAMEALLPAADKFPREPVIPYNLACYSCQMNQLDAARRWLDRAVTIGGQDIIKKMALADEDLKPLWPGIENW